jgi:NADH-quinone oxidoreductase subunit I
MLGTGILKGLAITAKNYLGSYKSDERLTTIQYPDEPARLPESFRNFPFLVYDGDDPVAGLRCVCCKMCETACPPQCIYIVQEKDANGKLVKKPRIFDIDISVCMGCGICVETCPFDSIKMDHVFEVATRERFDALLLHRDQLAKPASYFKQICPTEAARREEAAAQKKREAEERAAKAAAAKLATEKAAAEKAAAGSEKPVSE